MGVFGLLNPPLTNLVYFLLFPRLGIHLSPYWNFGATDAIGVAGSIGVIGAIGSTGAIDATSANPYSLIATLSATNNLHQLVMVGKQLC